MLHITDVNLLDGHFLSLSIIIRIIYMPSPDDY
ncbi:hypothetical protein BN439_1517 [Erwinia amylovora Ea644]|nr:hypothetical protein BN439_1517 [Erwinia amylovora Ea644]CCP06598.1 hypothetical protein BN440_1566 [Erwinia amylovora MR1]